MTALGRLQDEFQAYLLAEPNRATTHIVDAGNLNADERLTVYAEAYRLRLLEALETDFAALLAHLGADAFRALGLAYIAARPSSHYSLRYFGQHMAKFLAHTPPYADDSLLAELAAFDWALTTAFDAENDRALTIEEMAAVDPQGWPNLRFHARASVQRLDLYWNAPAIWKAADSGADTLPAPEQSPHLTAWVAWRQGLETFFRSLSVDEAYALDALVRGERFETICEGLCEWIDPEHAAGRAAGFLRQWVVDEMLREYSIAPR
jgi:Putative DNA-binding domain